MKMAYQPQIIIHNMQNDKFYRINKKSGRSQLSYRNGQSLKKFQPNITGFRNRFSQKEDLIGTKRKKCPLNGKKLHSKGKLKQYKVLEPIQLPTSRQQNLIKGQLIRNISYRSTKDIFATLVQNNDKIKTHLKKLSEHTESNLKQYEKIVKDKSSENHSPKKDTILGNESPSFDFMKTMCATIRNHQDNKIQGLQVKTKSRIHLKKYNRTGQLPTKFLLKEQYSNEQQAFYKLHPEYITHKDPLNHHKQKERNKNLLKLQKLFIQHNNQKTKAIYNTIHNN